MSKPAVALLSAAVFAFGLVVPMQASSYGGGGRGGPGTGAGPGHGGGGGYVVGRPGYGGYPGYGYAGWRGGYWGPRVGFYYGGPGYYWGGWPGAWGWGAWPGVWAASYAYPYSVAPIVINSTPQTQLFMQQEPAAIAAPQITPEISYWYYCTQPAGYFPYVKDCSEPWLKVVPQAPGEQPTAPRVAP